MADGSGPIVVDTPRSVHLLPYDERDVTPLEAALSGAEAQILDAPHDLIRDAWDPDRCPVHLLPYLAAAWSVDEWDPEWDEATRRRVIKASPDIHRVKGTVGALKRALAALGWGATVSQWFQHGGAPYTFRLRVAVPGLAEWSARQTGILMRIAIATKNVRSHLDRVTIARTAPPAPLAIGMAVVCRVRTRLVVEPVRAIRTPVTPLAIGAAVFGRVRCRLSPYAA